MKMHGVTHIKIDLNAFETQFFFAVFSNVPFFQSIFYCPSKYTN